MKLPKALLLAAISLTLSASMLRAEEEPPADDTSAPQVEQAKTAPHEDPKVNHVLRLDKANSKRLAELAKDLLDGDISAGSLVISADETNNSLVVGGTPNAIRRIRSLVNLAQGAAPADDEPGVAAPGPSKPGITEKPDLGPGTLLVLKHGNANSVAQALEKIYPDLTGRAILAQGASWSELWIRSNDEDLKKRLMKSVEEMEQTAARRAGVKVIQLIHARSPVVAATLNQLYANAGSTIVGNEEANTIWLRGPDELLKQLEACALRMDDPDLANKESQVAAQEGLARSQDERNERRLDREQAARAYAEKEQVAARLAAELQALQKTGKDAARLSQAKASLSNAVGEAFEARQRAQAAELGALRDRLQQLDRTIKAREQLKPQIIERRVEELLHPEQQWESEANPGRTMGSTTGPDSGGGGRGEPNARAAATSTNGLLRQQLQQRLLEAQVELELQQAKFVAGGNTARRDPSEKTLQEALSIDPTHARLSEQRASSTGLLADTKKRIASVKEETDQARRLQRDLEKVQDEVEKLDKALEERRTEVRAIFNEEARRSQEADRSEAQNRLASQRKLVDVLQQRIAELGESDSRRNDGVRSGAPERADASEKSSGTIPPAADAGGAPNEVHSLREADPRSELLAARSDLSLLIEAKAGSEPALIAAQERLAFVTSLQSKGYASEREIAGARTELIRAEAARKRAVAELESARRRVAQARVALKSHVKLLEIDVADAKLALERATIEEQNASKLLNLPKPIISSQEYKITRVARDRAALAVQRAETQLAPYAAALAEDESAPSREGASAAEGAATPAAQPERSSEPNPGRDPAIVTIREGGDARSEFLEAQRDLVRRQESKEVESAEAKTAAARLQLEQTKSLVARGAVPERQLLLIERELSQAEAARDRAKAEFAFAERRASQARDGLVAQIKLLEIDVASAKVELERVSRTEARAQDLFRTKSIHQSQVEEYQSATALARLAVQRAETRLAPYVAALRLYKEAVDGPSKDGTSQPISKPADKPQSAAPRRPEDTVVAIVGGQPLTWDDLARESIHRHGKDILDNLIDRRIVEQACAAQGIEVSDAEVDAEIDRLAKRFLLDRASYLKMLETQRQVSEAQYRRNVIWPTLALRKLATEEITISADEVKREFIRNYGVRVKARAIVLDDERRAAEVWKLATGNPDGFEDLARKHSVDPAGRNVGGSIPPIPRYGGSPDVEEAAFRLKEGEISPVIQTEPGKFLILKCEGRTTPPVEKLTPEIEAILREQLHDGKSAEVVERTFRQLKQQARVDRQLPEEPAAKR